MKSLSRRPSRRGCVVVLSGAIALLPVLPAVAQQDADAGRVGATEMQLQSWHESLRNYAPVEDGCFQTAYPSVHWEKVACGPKPAFVSGRRPAVSGRRGVVPMGEAAAGAGVGQTVGNGYDYVAQTGGITQSGLGTFPTVTNVTSETGKGVAAFGGGGLLGPNEYTLQLNSDINPNAAACSAFGYASCYVWEQFVYLTADKSYGYPSQVFMQNWVFPSTSDYNYSGCPSGRNDASSSGSPACYVNSAATNTPSVSPTKLATLKLSGVVSAGRDTAMFTSGSQAYAASEADTTVHLGSWWKQSEFNVVGNAGGSEAVFNKGASITVNLVVKDGSTNAPTCVSDAGSTGETNNLTLKACKTTAGASPSISFTESD